MTIQWIRNHAITIVGIILLGASLFFFGLSFQPGNFIVDYGANLATELLSVAITVIVIDRLYALRQRRELRALLTRDLKSKSAPHAVRAVEELRHLGWLDEVLQEQKEHGLYMAVLDGANLNSVDLSGADIKAAKFRNANLFGANLDQADARKTRMQHATLVKASLRGTRLCFAYLQDAFLQEANLEGADLQEAELGAATLPHANLRRALNITEEQLRSVALIGGTTMPDGTVLSEEDLLEDVRQGIEGPNLEEWFAFQRSLPVNERVIELSASRPKAESTII